MIANPADSLKAQRRVTFDSLITTITTHDSDVYDRTSINVRPLKYKDIIELNSFIQEMQKQYYYMHTHNDKK